MMFFYQILFLLTTYLLASIPFGLVLTKIFLHKDIRENGSKNIGATNVARVAGKKLGALTLLLDGLKGALMVVMARFFFVDCDNLHLFLVIVALVAVIAHIYPIYLNFKGGKGVATAMAVLLALDLTTGIIAISCWIITFLISRISSVSSMVGIFSSVVFSIYFSMPNSQIFLCIALFVIILIRHKENIARLLSGQEKSFK